MCLTLMAANAHAILLKHCGSISSRCGIADEAMAASSGTFLEWQQAKAQTKSDKPSGSNSSI